MYTVIADYQPAVDENCTKHVTTKINDGLILNAIKQESIRQDVSHSNLLYRYSINSIIYIILFY